MLLAREGASSGLRLFGGLALQLQLAIGAKGELIMRVQCQILSEGEQQKIHEDSIRILEQIGTQFMSNRALKILKEGTTSLKYRQMFLKKRLLNRKNGQ